MFLLIVTASAHEAAVRAAAVNESLLEEIANGDSQAFSDFYNQTKTAVYSLALSILKNPHDAQDVMQDTYIKVHANAHTYSPHGKPLAWVFTITRNLCLMHLRKNGGKSAEFLDELDYENPLDFAKSFEDGQIIALAMKALNDDERQIVVMHAVSGLKHRDIANMLDMPVSTVLSKYNRSLGKMKRQLAQGGVKK